MTRETDYLPSIGAQRDVRQSVAHAIGLNRDFVSSDEKAFWALRDKVNNELCHSDICEWFSLSDHLLNEIEDKIIEGFTEVQFVFKNLEYNPECFDNYSIEQLESGESVLDFNIDIDWSGGGCPETSMIAEIEASYLKENKTEKLADEYDDRPFHINRSMAQSFKRFTAENYPNGFFEDKEDEVIEETKINPEAIQLIAKTPESKFKDKILEYAEKINKDKVTTNASINLMIFIAYDSSPEDFIDILDEGETLAEAIKKMAEWTTSKEGLEDYLQDKIKEAKGGNYLDEFGICPSGSLDYLDIDTFIDDLDRDFVIDSIKTCWSMVSNEPIP